MTHYRLKTLTSLIASACIVISLAGCVSGRGPYRRGTKAEMARDYETAMNEYKAALERDPSNIDYRLKYEQTRFAAGFAHFEAGRRAMERGDVETAKREFEQAIAIDPTHDFAVKELRRAEDIQKSRDQKQPEPERRFDDLKDSTRVDPRFQSQMEPKITGPITFRMAQDSRVAFETLADLAGFNVIFDTDFRGVRIPIELNNVDIYEALDILSLQTRSFWQPINKNTILVSPDNQTKRREYEQHIVKTIYLSNSVTSTEITEAITALRTILNTRYITQFTAMNAIIIRDTPDKIAIAEKILDDLDKGKPEVVVEALVLEVDRNQLNTLGINPPTSVNYTGQTTTSTTGTTTNTNVNLRDLDALNSGSFSVTIPSATAQFLATTSGAKLIQNPKVRATDNKIASIRIGSKVPVPSGSFQPAFVGATGTPVVQYVYQDIGVNLDITPRVLLNREVSLAVLVQVSALAGDRDAGGLKLPVFTNRSIQHEIRLKEGETNILGGIITTTEASSLVGIPGLKDIPILKYLFSQETKQRDSTEIIVMLTPHIVRMPDLTRQNLQGLYIGTEVNTRLRQNAPIPAPFPPIQQPAAATPPAPAAPAGQLPPLATAPGSTTTAPPGVTIGTPAPAAPAAPAPPRPTNATVTFDPSPVTVAAGQPTTLNIGITGNDIYAADLTLSYDPASIRIQDIRDGGFLSRDGQIIALIQKVESENGTARISLERPPGAAPLSGNGALITLILQPGAQKGESILRVIDFRLRDAQQNVMVGRATETRVTVP
jgi:general secretion pathway protein D